jgi:T5SS/PEP-CTERM-associated repeat protein
VLVTALVVAAWPADVTLAVQRNWIGGTGSWSTPGLWNPAGVPGAGDEAFIAPTDGVARTVTYDYAGPAVTLAAVRVDLNVGAVGTTTLAMPGNNLSAADLHVGYSGSGTFTQTGGTTDVDNTVWVSTNFGSTGAVTVSGATTNLTADWMSMGSNGEGTLTIENGGHVSVQNKTGIGDFLNGLGTVVVRGAGSTLNAIGWADVGSYGAGELTITDHGRVTGGGVYIGGGPSGYGQVEVSGAGSILDPGFISVGSQGEGELFISDSGISAAQNGVVIGGAANGVGIATVSGVGAEFRAAWYLAVGAEGNGSLIIENGGLADADNSFTIGAQSTGVGNAYVTGTGSRLEGAWNVLVGERGAGALTVDNGGLVSTPGWLITGLHPGSSGTLHVGPGGTARSDQQVQIADLAGSVGDAVVSGAGARLESGWGIGVGNEGQATLTVEGGATAESNNGVFVGDKVSGRGEVTIRGTGSSLTADWGIEVGDEGRGTLAVSDGATVAAQNGFVVGRSATGVGEVSVDGIGTSASGAWYVRVGESGKGTISVGSGGTLSTPADIDVGVQSGGKGVLNIESGSSVSSFRMNIGGTSAAAGGQGVVNVNTGGTLNASNRLTVWNNAGNALNLRGGTINTPSLILNGNPALFNWTGGTLHLTAGMTFDPFASTIFGTARTISGTQKLKITGLEGLGPTGGFTLTVTNGGVHEVSDAIVINANGALRLHNGGTVIADRILHTDGGTFEFTGGTLHVNTFYGNLVNAGGTLSPGNSVGTTTVDYSYLQYAGKLQIEIASAASYDKLVVGGTDLAFGGTLEVSLLNAYSPIAGDFFNIIDWTVAITSGTFAALNLPALSGGLAWNTSQLYTTGVLSVTSAAVPGDYNNNGAVDAADYLLWRKGGPLANEVDVPGTVNGADYTAWRARFGNSGSGAGLADAGFGTADIQGTVVPEPATFALLAMALTATFLSLRRRNIER